MFHNKYERTSFVVFVFTNLTFPLNNSYAVQIANTNKAIIAEPKGIPGT